MKIRARFQHLASGAALVCALNFGCVHSGQDGGAVPSVTDSDTENYGIEGVQGSTLDPKPIDDDILAFGLDKGHKNESVHKTQESRGSHNGKADHSRNIRPSKNNTFVVKTKTLKIRNAPSPKAKLMGRLHRGDAVQVESKKSGWAKIGENQWVLFHSLKAQ